MKKTILIVGGSHGIGNAIALEQISAHHVLSFRIVGFRYIRISNKLDVGLPLLKS